MKKLLMVLLLALGLIAFVPGQSLAKAYLYWAQSLTGGGAGALDAIDACNTDGAGTDLANGDAAIVVTGTSTYTYTFDIDSAAAESSPRIIKPDNCDGSAYSGDGRWLLVEQPSLTPVIDDPDNFASNFTGVNLYGGIFISNAAGTANLPAAGVGMYFTYVLEGANANVIHPDATGTTDTIVMNGLAAAQGENITSSTSGAMCVFQYRAADSWMATCNGFAEATPP